MAVRGRSQPSTAYGRPRGMCRAGGIRFSEKKGRHVGDVPTFLTCQPVPTCQPFSRNLTCQPFGAARPTCQPFIDVPTFCGWAERLRPLISVCSDMALDSPSPPPAIRMEINEKHALEQHSA